MAEPDSAAALAAAAATAFVIDLRDDGEKHEGVCERAHSVPWSSWTRSEAAEGTKVPPAGAVPEDKAAVIITHCRGGGRGGKAKASLQALGFTNVLNGGGPQLSDLWDAWAGAGGQGPEPEPEPEAVPILKNNGAPPSDAAGRSVVWNEENLLQNEAERPEGGYMKIDEPDTPFEYTVKPVSDSESDEEGGAFEAGGDALTKQLGFDADGFAAAFEAKRHTVVQGVDDDREEATSPAPEPESEPAPEPEPEPEPEPAYAGHRLLSIPLLFRPVRALLCAARRRRPKWCTRRSR